MNARGGHGTRTRRVALALFTRDLRVHDNPVLAAAARADATVPLFVLDDRLLASPFASANRAAFLRESLADLRDQLTQRGSGLVVRQGDTTAEVARLAREVDAAEVHVASDVSAYARDRERRLRAALEEQGRALHVHEAVLTAHEPGALTPTGRDHFAVFTPYFRRWSEVPLRPLADTPRRIRLPDVARGGLPSRARICAGTTAPRLARGGETQGRLLMQRWARRGVERYLNGQDDLAADESSRLSPYLHFGCLSAVELARVVGRDEPARAFVRQLAWRDFHHQVLAARPAASWCDYRTRGDRWRDDEQALEAWKSGRTGFPVVDAGMRQLHEEGWMHNRARLVAASFLTKTLYLDWRLGAQHFLDHLVDGDIANNNMNWQWAAGTGTDTRPNRVLNAVRQAHRYDPRGDYVRRYVPELADLPVNTLHEPQRLGTEELERRGYPPPIVDLAQANAHFRDTREVMRGC